MAIQQISLFDRAQFAPAKKAAPLRLPPSVKNDVFLNALLEASTAKHEPRNPLEWIGAAALHIVLIAVLIIVPLYTTAKITLGDYEDVPLVAPPPPLPPAPPAGGAVAPHAVHAKPKVTYQLGKLSAPTRIPKKISVGASDATAAPDFGVSDGVPGGVIGGQIGGVVGGVPGGTGSSAPPPPPPPATPRPAAKKIVKVGSDLKAPRQTYSVDPVFPPLARQAHVFGTVVVDAVIDERGNVVQARALSGHPLLVDAALKAVLQWKYEPTVLNGQPVSVELKVSVTFK